jgi:hypothetical protein
MSGNPIRWWIRNPSSKQWVTARRPERCGHAAYISNQDRCWLSWLAIIADRAVSDYSRSLSASMLFAGQKNWSLCIVMTPAAQKNMQSAECICHYDLIIPVVWRA